MKCVTSLSSKQKMIKYVFLQVFKTIRKIKRYTQIHSVLNLFI